MTVTLTNHGLLVQGSCLGSLDDFAGPCSKPHGSSFVRNRLLFLKKGNDGIRCFFVKFSAIGLFQTSNISGKFNDSDLHSETKSQVRNFRFAGKLNSFNFTLGPAISKSPWNKNAINLLKLFN